MNAIHLDHLYFVPLGGDCESVFHADGEWCGDIGFDDVRKHSTARKMIGGDLSPWRPMRCIAEARAFIVSRRRMQ